LIKINFVWYLGTGYPKVCPQPPSGPSVDQSSVEQLNEVERTTRSSTELACETERSNPHRAASRGGATDQLPAEQPCEVERPTDQLPVEQPYEAERPTNSEPGNHARRRFRPDTIDLRRLRQDASSSTHVRTYVQHTEGTPGGRF
jgi:hypothetical protein